MLPNTIHPGEFLSEILEERGISQSHLARHIGVEPGVINLICKRRRGVSAAMAKKLARALGTDAELWVNLQGSYDLTQAQDPDSRKRKYLCPEKSGALLQTPAPAAARHKTLIRRLHSPPERQERDAPRSRRQKTPQHLEISAIDMQNSNFFPPRPIQARRLHA